MREQLTYNKILKADRELTPNQKPIQLFSAFLLTGLIRGLIMKNLTQQEIHYFIDYDPTTGICRWKNPLSPRVHKGDIIGCANKSGHLRIVLNNQHYLLHRIIWLYYYGVFPTYNLDHINQNPSDNRIDNLREATKQCNARNCPNPKNNTSGVKGVVWNKANNNWRVGMHVNWKHINLGSYKVFDDAVCARLAGEQCVDWAGCDSNSPAYKYVKENIQ